MSLNDSNHLHYKGIDGFGDSMNDSIHDYLRKNHMMVEMLADEFNKFL